MQERKGMLHAVELPFYDVASVVEMECDVWLGSYTDSIDDEELLDKLNNVSGEDILKFINTSLSGMEIDPGDLSLSPTDDLPGIDAHLFELADMIITGWLFSMLLDDDTYALHNGNIKHIWFHGLRWGHNYKSGVILLRIESKDGECIRLFR